jgi:hypothetical protein
LLFDDHQQKNSITAGAIRCVDKSIKIVVEVQEDCAEAGLLTGMKKILKIFFRVRTMITFEPYIPRHVQYMNKKLGERSIIICLEP